LRGGWEKEVTVTDEDITFIEQAIPFFIGSGKQI
jgi:hypothetical protein